MSKGVFALFIVAVAAASAAMLGEELAIRDDPYLQRVVEEAIEMGENSILNLAMRNSASSEHKLDSPREIESSLLAISSDILGTPAPRAAAASRGAPLGVSFVSVDERAEFEKLLGKSEEERLIEAGKAAIAAGKVEDNALLNQFEDLSATVDRFQNELQQEESMSFADATVTAEEAAQVEAEEAAKNAEDADHQADFEADVEAELDADAEFDLQAETDERIAAAEPVPSADAEAEAEGALLEEEYDLSSFLELSSALGVQLGAEESEELRGLLASLAAPALEEEAVEPTLTEEAEAAAEGHALPTASFLLTEEELTAQLEALQHDFATRE